MSSSAVNPFGFFLVLADKIVQATQVVLTRRSVRPCSLGALRSSEVAAMATNVPRQGTDETLLWDLSAVLFPASSVTASGDNQRPAATRSSASATPPSGLRFPSKSCSARTPKRFVGTLRKCIASALGSRPHSQGFAQCDPSKLGKFKTETISCTRTKSLSSAS
jgi:hypothetical protein